MMSKMLTMWLDFTRIVLFVLLICFTVSMGVACLTRPCSFAPSLCRAPHDLHVSQSYLALFGGTRPRPFPLSPSSLVPLWTFVGTGPGTHLGEDR